MKIPDDLRHRHLPLLRSPRIRMSLAVTSVVAFMCGTAHFVSAQSGDAEELFNQGNKLMEQGDLVQACEAFEASNRAEPTAGTLIQLAKCLSHRGRIASAWSTYKDALTRAKDLTKRKIAGDAVAALESRLSYLTIAVSDENRVEQLTITRDGDPLETTSWNHALPVDGSDYAIAARAPRHRSWHATAHVEPEQDRVVIDIPRLDALPGPAEASPSPIAPPSVSPTRVMQLPATQPHSSLSATRKISIGLGVASMLALATAATLGTAASREQADASQLCPDAARACAQSAQANALVRAGNRWAFDANVAWRIAGGAALASGILWLFGGSSEAASPPIAVMPTATSGAIGVAVIRRSSW